MNKGTYLVKFLNNHNDVVHQFCITTCRIVRALDCARSWLAGNNYKFKEHVVVSVVAEKVDLVEDDVQ